MATGAAGGAAGIAVDVAHIAIMRGKCSRHVCRIACSPTIDSRLTTYPKNPRYPPARRGVPYGFWDRLSSLPGGPLVHFAGEIRKPALAFDDAMQFLLRVRRGRSGVGS